MEMKTNILRPNPNWEEDLENSTLIDPAMMERIKSYHKIKKIHRKRSCHCADERKSRGAATWLPLNDGRWIPNFGLGTWMGLTKDGERVKKKDLEVTQAVEWAIESGYRHLDTAAIYGTEREVGEGIKHKIAEGIVKREDLFVCTKLWNDVHARETVVPALRGSLRRLKLDYVDLYLIHWPISLDPDGAFSDIDYLETWQGMIDARNLGLTKSIGVSNFNESMLERLIVNSSMRPAVLQIELNLNLQQDSLRLYCCKHGIQIQGYTPFGSVLPDKARSVAPPPRIDDIQLGNIARRYRKTVPQIILRYILEIGVIPIPKSVTKNRIEENINIFDFQLCQCDKNVLKSYDVGYRTLEVLHWSQSAYYPFNKNT